MKLNVCAMHTMHCLSWLSVQYNNKKLLNTTREWGEWESFFQDWNGTGFPPSFFVDWDRMGFVFVGVGRERFENPLLCHPLLYWRFSTDNTYIDNTYHIITEDILYIAHPRLDLSEK